MLISILLNNNLDPLDAVIQFLMIVFVFTFSLSLREFFRAFAAYKMGDATAKSMGMMTINPIKHIDPAGFLFFVLLGVGWSKPVPINPTNFKNYRKGIRWVSAAGVLVNFVFGLLASIVYLVFNRTLGCPNEAMGYFYLLLQIIMQINSFLVLFNILPIYPLAGFDFVTTFMKSNNKFIYFNYKNGVKILYGILIVSVVFELLFGFDLFAIYLNLLYNYIYLPIALI